ncbi:glycerol-3-phosphate oxidase [Spiroplasma clarkii]|uniref:Glycerol-3-phosphate oxidase n=1 Tax=Spiroplasma clarkii TaxID=2139 RepID=A0A1Y0KYP9_9MOLU|nr:type 2 glycerol-3-phosphate oxidase [Spiroplasma clarkii]ARU90864.1 glycerol-3-phosphate oxidase [Spiroplasma clarkii]ATX71649.1 glycerol-3-phosphate oxidase [Spiroplasma clarkii]
MKYDVCIIGAGVIGASVARELAKYNLKTVVLEANPSFAQETSQGNSGLIHGGFDPKPEKINAKLNQEGKKLFAEHWFKELDFKHAPVNSIVLAFNEAEEKNLEELIQRGIKNGCTEQEIKIINQDVLQKLEPNINPNVKKALLCTSSVVLDPVELTGVLLKNAIKNGTEVKFSEKVIGIEKPSDFKITTNKGVYEAKVIINCAGHYADEIAKLAGYPDFELTTKRGEYIVLNQTKANSVNNVLFMVPDIHGKGVIVAPTLTGKVLVGPTAVDGVPKDETRLITREMEDHIKAIGLKIIPGLDMSKICLRFSGSRPIYKETDDFYIKTAKADQNFINVAGMKSPALSAAPAIAAMVEKMLGAVLPLDPKANWDRFEKNVFYNS